MKPRVDRLVAEKSVLRGMKRSDIPRWSKWFNDNQILQHSVHRFRGYTEEQQTMVYEKLLNDPTKVQFMICEPKQLIGIGVISFTVSSHLYESADISIIIGEKQYWGKGIATEAIEEIIGYCVKHHKITRFTAGWDVRNVGSQKAFEKNGFVVFEKIPKLIKYLDEEKLHDTIRSEKLI